MTTIKLTFPKQTYVYNLNFETQTAPSGRHFRLSGISKNLEVPEKWINRVLKNHWIYTFKFLDGNKEFIYFYFDYYDNFISLQSQSSTDRKI